MNETDIYYCIVFVYLTGDILSLFLLILGHSGRAKVSNNSSFRSSSEFFLTMIKFFSILVFRVKKMTL